MKAADPQQEEKLRRLLRLKRYEQPPEEFADEFLEKFQRRQRGELLRRSSLSIFRERLVEWLHGLRRPAVLWSAAGAYAAIMVTLWLLPRPVPQNGTTVVMGTVVTTSNVDYQPNAVHPVSAQMPNPVLPSAPGTNPVPPGKRRVTNQSQDKEEIIGPDQSPKRDAEKLRDL